MGIMMKMLPEHKALGRSAVAKHGRSLKAGKSPVPNEKNIRKSMAYNRGEGGIPPLLTAEQEAQHIVNAARRGVMGLLDYCEVDRALLSPCLSLRHQAPKHPERVKTLGSALVFFNGYSVCLKRSGIGVLAAAICLIGLPAA
ncbi:unnamed protein product [Prunus armeniaca]|uniref:Uncharacterized protein n=1 Tax=Prunus armeniaca TaxID=36596 RepID=A0A6J5VE96_PRUAR|nr:unnamed protein product [Prunus armeniaca]